MVTCVQCLEDILGDNYLKKGYLLLGSLLGGNLNLEIVFEISILSF